MTFTTVSPLDDFHQLMSSIGFPLSFPDFWLPNIEEP